MVLFVHCSGAPRCWRDGNSSPSWPRIFTEITHTHDKHRFTTHSSMILQFSRISFQLLKMANMTFLFFFCQKCIVIFYFMFRLKRLSVFVRNQNTEDTAH